MVAGKGAGMKFRPLSLLAFARYNASQVFAGKFIYFLLLSLVIFCIVVFVHTAQQEVPPNVATIYYFLLVPGIMLIFYPAAYSVQGDVDARMLETLFGIPDYRYKVWLARQVVQQLVIAMMLWLLAMLCKVALADFSVGAMLFHLMFPTLFLGSVGFMLATTIHSGNGAAATLVVVCFFAWIFGLEVLQGSRWNMFHNPFELTDSYVAMIHEATTFHNRVYLLVGSVLATLMGLLRLQRRERFVG